MPVIERTVAVDRPLPAVWDYLSDFRSSNDWDPGTVRTEVAQGDGGIGTVYHNVSRFLGREVEVDYTVTRLEPQQRLDLEGGNKTVKLHDTMTFRDTSSGDRSRTEVTYTARFDFQGVARLAAPLMGPALKKLGDEAEEGLRRELGKLPAS